MGNERKICYIYKIICLMNNRIYIGQTTNFINRKNVHKWKLNHNCCDSRLLQEDYNKYDPSDFKFEIIEECSKEDLLIKETYWMNYYGSIESNNIYNMRDLSGCNKELLNYLKEIHINKPVSLETRQKLRELNLGKNNPMYGKKQSVESNRKRSNTLKVEYFQKKLKESNKQRGKRKYSEEFILEVRNKYNELKSYKETALYFNLNKDTCSNLIKFGTNQRPYRYSKN